MECYDMKKVCALLLGVLVFAGCSGGGQTASSQAESAAPARQPTKFDQYVSNTVIATGNNKCIDEADGVTYRGYFPLEAYGTFDYSFYFSNTVDSTWDGGRLVDRISRKKFMYGVMLLWMGALTAYLLTANYYALLVFMIFSLGASTMLSTTVNLLTPLVYAAPALFVNFFNFLQGAGISTAQNVGGRFASSLSAWKGANLILLACGCVGLVLLWFVKLPQPKPDAGSAGGYGAVIRNPACKYLFLLCGFYCITEHGLQNWLVTYGSDYLGYTVPQAARYLSFFFGGIMAGRLLFAPLVQKCGIMRSMRVFVAAAGVLYVSGMLLERRGMLLLCGSGLAFSILWPTIVLLIGRYYDPGLAGTATGFITGFATLFDVAFNACFGKLIDWLGFGTAIQILPVSMLLLCLSFFLLRIRVPKSKEIL